MKGEGGGEGERKEGFFPFFPTPSPLTRAIFRAVFDSRSLFFAPKQLGNACYAGYKTIQKIFQLS